MIWIGLLSSSLIAAPDHSTVGLSYSTITLDLKDMLAIVDFGVGPSKLQGALAVRGLLLILYGFEEKKRRCAEVVVAMLARSRACGLRRMRRRRALPVSHPSW